MTKSAYIVLLICTILFSCTNDDDTQENDSLASLVAVNEIVKDNVIACAALSKTNPNTVLAYAYPRPGATDLRYYETTSIADDKNDYTHYKNIDLEPSDVFNGYLKKFARTTSQEKWVIITFFENDKLHLSNPIRLKHLTKPTEFSSEANVNNETTGMPMFSWNDGTIKENKIYFQVISDTSNNLLSGTYTVEKQFQYYNLDNVVLNVTTNTPPELNLMASYNFTLMGVSEDNWVNLFIEKNFALN